MVEFYRETEFKETEIGRIPKDWSLRELEKLCHKIKAGGTPLTRICLLYTSPSPRDS